MKKSRSVAFSLNVKLNFKILVVGDKGVGKTSLIIRYVKNSFQNQHQNTLGVDYYSRILQCDDGNQATLQIWDTAGQNNISSVAKSFYHLASCVLILYDRPENMQKNIDHWIYDINEEVHQSARIALIRTKIDEIPVDSKEQEKIDFLVEKYNLDLFKGVSSKDNTHVFALFNEMGNIMNQLYQKNKDFKRLVDPKSDSIYLSDIKSKPQKRTNCCH